MEIVVGNETFNLHKGDSLRFEADIQHKYRNIGKKEVQLSMVIYYGK